MPAPRCATVQRCIHHSWAYCTLEGARCWDEIKIGALDDSRPKEPFASMPAILVKATVTVDKAELKDAYD